MYTIWELHGRYYFWHGHRLPTGGRMVVSVEDYAAVWAAMRLLGGV